MVTVTSLYICISYIYAYSYNFYDLSSLHAYCMSISFGTFFVVFGISFIYTFLVSILCIFHIHSITYYSLSLVYITSILLLYSCLSHILCLFLVICLYLILDLFHIISYPVLISCLLSCSGYTSMLYFSFFIFILVLSYTFILYAFIMYFSYIVILYYSYTLYTFVRSYSIIYFMLSYIFCTFLVLV